MSLQKKRDNLRADLRVLDEFVAGGSVAALMAIKAALPQYIDDVSKDFGLDIYESKMMNDPTVGGCIDILIESALAEGIQITPAVSFVDGQDESTQYEAKEALYISEFIRRNLEDTGEDIVQELLRCLYLGYQVSEITLHAGSGEDGGRFTLKSVSGKSWRNLAFVADPYGNVSGFLVRKPGEYNTLTSGYEVTEETPNFVPRWKFAVAQWAIQNGDPRGSSILRRAYNAWFIKTQVLPDYFKYLKQFATPGLIGKTPIGDDYLPKTDENGEIVSDESGNQTLIAAEVALLSTLLAYANGTALAVRGGTEIDFLQSDGDGSAFLNAQDFFNREIAMAILGSPRAVLEGKHGSLKDSSAAQDILGLRIGRVKRLIAKVIKRDIVNLLVGVNFGYDKLHLAPTISLVRVEQQDWASELNAVSDALAKGVLHRTQLPFIWKRFGFEPADMEAVNHDLAEQEMNRKLGKLNYSKLIDPDGGDE